MRNRLLARSDLCRHAYLYTGGHNETRTCNASVSETESHGDENPGGEGGPGLSGGCWELADMLVIGSLTEIPKPCAVRLVTVSDGRGSAEIHATYKRII